MRGKPGRASDTRQRKNKEKEQRREMILHAARGLMLKKGYAAVSIRRISEISELGIGTIYSYFSGKAEIYAALSREVFDLLDVHLRVAMKGASPAPERLRRIGAALLEFTVKQKAWYEFLDYFMSAPKRIFPVLLKEQIDQYGEKVLEPVISAINEGIESGAFSRVDAKEYALIFMGMLHGIIHFRKVEDTVLEGRRFEELFNRSIECFIISLGRRE